MKFKSKNNTIEILKEIKNSIQNNEAITSSKNLTEQNLLSEYKKDAIDLLINLNFKINANEYNKLKKQYIKLKKQKESTAEIELIIKKYENTLIYLIKIGCSKYLKSFKKEFINNLLSNFSKKFPNKLVYEISGGSEIGYVTDSGRVLMIDPSNNYAIGKDQLNRKSKPDRYKRF